MTPNTYSTGTLFPRSSQEQPDPQGLRLFQTRFRLALIAGLSLQAFGIVFAQQPTAAPTEEPTIVLSPFVVDASKDQGYRATSTLAGSRINTPLKDLGASITVVTSEFLSDVSAVSINDILSYTANTEGLHDYTQLGAGASTQPRDSAAESPQTANRLRGLASADITRDYFYSIGANIGFDTYNLDEVTINRGPNSVLAGLGSAGGIINYSPQLAYLTKNNTQVSFRLGSFGDERATFNSNIVALKDVFAIRVAGAWSDTGFKQKPSYNHDRRGYAAFTYSPWKKTTIRGSYETVRVKAHQPNTLTPEDDITQWIAVGRPTYDATSAAPVSSSLTKNDIQATVFYSSTGSIINAFNRNLTYSYNQANLGKVDLWTPTRFNNNTYGNWDALNTNPNKTDHQMETVTLSLDQEILPDLVANISYLRETGKNNDLVSFTTGFQDYSIDVNKYVLSATGWVANPQFGKTYFYYNGGDNYNTDKNTNEAARATLAYKLDLTKVNKWLGHYNFTAFGEQRKTELRHSQGDSFRIIKGATTALESTARLYYVGGSETTQAQSGPSQQLGLVQNVPFNYIDPVSGAFKSNTLTDAYLVTQDRKSLTELDSTAFVAQGYLLDDRIVPMFGIRHDTNKATSLSHVRDDASTGLSTPLGDYPPEAAFSRTTKTYGGVVHPLKWLSLHYSRAQNFVPSAGSMTLDGVTTAAPSGIGRDYGFSLALLDDKLNLKVNWFNLASKSAPSAAANFPIAQWVMPFAETVIMPAIAQAAGIQYKPRMVSSLAVGDSRLANAYTSDQVSKGLEIEMTYNVTKNWRVMGNISKQEATETNIAPELTAFIEERLAYWQATPGLWTGPVANGVPWGGQRTGQQFFNDFMLSQYLGYKSRDGKPSAQIAKWHASGLTSYSFSDDNALKGFTIGGGARYIDKAWLGSPVIKNSSGAVTGLDVAHSYYYNAYVSLDAWIGYSTKFKVFGNRAVTFQLNGRDLQEGGSYRPIAANSDGTKSVFRIVQPRTFYLTTKIEF